MRGGCIVWKSNPMRQREFERRVKGTVDKPRKRKRERSEESHPGRTRPVLKALLAAACAVALLVITANGSRYFAVHGGVSNQPVQVTEEQALARANVAAAPVAAAVHHVARRVRYRRAAAEEASVHHALAAAAHRHSSDAIASAAHGKAAAAVAQSGEASIDEETQWLQSKIRSAFTPFMGYAAAASAADTVLLHLPVVAGAGVFVVVMLLCLVITMAASPRPHRSQGAGI